MKEKFDITGRVAVVTGSTRGLGRVFALSLAEAGADIVIVGRDAEAAASVAEEVTRLGRRALVCLAEVTSRVDVERVRDATVAEFGRVDILVNNAGTCIHKPALEVTDDEWREVMGVNIDGMFLMAQAVGKEMLKAGRGGRIDPTAAGRRRDPRTRPSPGAGRGRSTRCTA